MVRQTHTLYALVLLTFLMGAAKAENEDAPLLGIRHRNETTQAMMNYVSMAGGLEFFVDGKGFDDMPSLNQVQFETLQGSSVMLIGQALNNDDQVQSSTVNGRLAYTMPSMTQLMGNVPISAYSTHYLSNTSEFLKMRIKVANTAEATDSSCHTNIAAKCEVHYSLRYTPVLLDTVPNQVYWDQEINFVLNAMRANHKSVISADMDPVVFIKIDGTRCDSEGLIDYETRLGESRVDTLRTRAGDQQPGKGVPEVRFRVGNALLRETAKHCNWAGDDCWNVKTHPKIDKISAATGYTTGGQTLEITGWGLKGTKITDVDVTVDGVACKVLTSTIEKITCMTGAASAVSHAGDQPGSPGLRQKLFNPTNNKENVGWSTVSAAKTPVTKTSLMTSWEDNYNDIKRALKQTKGWFKAPEAGDFRFYLSCDDFCKVWLGKTKWSKAKSDAYTMTETNVRHSASTWRNYNLPQDPNSSHKWQSDWITLEKGEFYKIESQHGEYSGSDHMTVSVEFKKTSTLAHHHNTKELQIIELKNEMIYERFNITVTKLKEVNDGKFQIGFVNPKYNPSDKNSPQTVLTREVNDDDSEYNMAVAIQDYYGNWRIWGSAIEVKKYKTDKHFTTVDSDHTHIVYSVRVKKAISDVGFSQASIALKKGTTSEITIGTPYTKSSTPLSGNFIVHCKNADGNDFESREMYTHQDTNSMAMFLHWDIPHLQLKLHIESTWKYQYRENGLEFSILFQDYRGNPPQCMIKSGKNKPIAGGGTITYVNTTPRSAGNNLMFEPVPLEMLYHDAAKPQVLITVNKIEGVCPQFNCDYLYATAPSEVTAQAIGVNGKDITITGTSLPTKDVKVILGNTECGTVTAQATSITCTLSVLPAAGAWNVEVYDPSGLVPVKSDVAKINVALVVTSVSPATALNQLGGDVLTITGTGFDKDMSKVGIAFSDTTKCDVQSASPTEIKCLVAGFDKAKINASTPYAATVTVNTVNNADRSVGIKETFQKGQTISPTSVSPVLHSVLTVTLESTYPGDMTKKDNFKAELIGKTDETIIRPLYVKAVDASAKTVTIKFPGATSGEYYVSIVASDIGRIDRTPLLLKVEGRVTAIAPLTGSYLGGTLVTIDGVNFSTNKLDNPVKAGNSWCHVQTTNKSQITCRVAETKATKTSTGPLSTFLKASEEAKKDIDNTFAFATPVATVTGITAAFDAATNKQVLTLAGSSFTTTHANIELWIDGTKQTSVSATASEAKFTMIHIDSESANVVTIYFPDGFPTGYDKVKTVTVTPNLIEITPSSGSTGGTLLTVTGTGFGKKTAGLTLVNAAGNDVCAKVTITAYGSFTCMTKPGEMVKSDKLKIKTSKASYACANTDATKCDYEQLTASSPTMTAITVASSTTLAVVGTNFPTSGYTCSVIFKGVTSTSAIISSATGVTATFAQGVPVTKAEASAIIRFTPTSRRMLSGTENFIEASTTVKLANEASVTASTSGLECSFQGGCKYTVTANGLTSTLKANTADKIDVCGETCVMDESSSDASKVDCTVPFVATTYSATNYKVVTAGAQHTGIWTGTASKSELARLIDGKNTIDLTDSTSTNCYFQIAYKTAHVVVLDEAKFFVNELSNKTPFIGLKFQGSNDGTAFTDLWTVDEEVHEGWNSHDFEAGKEPAFNIYRFQGKVAGSCRIGEVRLHGVESIADNNASYACTPKLWLDGASTNLQPITFKNTKTPKLTSMSTRFGSVLGNESVVFTGTDFSASATTTVKIDDRVCTVTAKTTTTITCTTANKPYVKDTPRLVINIDGMGDVATMGKTFLYVSKWDDPQTWGNDLPPQDGEAVSIPKGQHLLFNIDKGPKLTFLNVEGSLIFPPSSDANHVRTFDAHYILVKAGYMEVGTEDHRYTSKLTITMWSTKYGPQIPLFGNKVIGVNFGTLEMHGINRPITWTDLKSTAALGATSITLNDMKDGKSLDWKVGEEIVIAPTTYSGRDAEQRTIKSITAINSNPVITFDGPLLTKHYAGVQTFGSDTIEMRAEVGLLTRNVVYRGDPEHSPDNQYGAVIICHSPGDESTVCRIDSVELTMVGQAFILGSYPIHFHMIGTVHQSYVRNNAIHHSFNRAVTIHGIHYLRVQNNVAYHTMGHTIFIEDGIETKNLIENNLILDVRRSWSLLNTDQTPASIWLTNPDNIVRGNHAGGSDRYSYWYDLQTTSIGPSFDPNVCPENQKLGEFNNNVAHSNGRYGLRIFHNHIPRVKQCAALNYDTKSASYNPPIPAIYKNLVSYKNKRNGAIIERAGAIEWHNFKTADNLEVGMEMSRTNDNLRHGYAKIIGGLVVGKSENTEEALEKVSPMGVRTPRTEYFEMNDTKFYNFNWQSAAAIMTCSHCWHDANTDSGGRTMFVNNLFFDSTVQKIVSYSTPFMTIFLDKSGSMTGKGANSWFLPYYKHLLQPECERVEAKGGIVCDNTVQARRVAIHGMPSNFFGMRLKIMPMEEAAEQIMKNGDTWQAFKDAETNYGIVPYKQKLLPMDAWAMPFVTGHRYRLHWEAGLDFDGMKLEVSEMWATDDKDIRMVFNFTEKREAVNITTSYGTGTQIANNTLSTLSTWSSGDYQLRNATELREFEILINGKDASRNNLQVSPHECILGACKLDEVKKSDIPTASKPWSAKESWPSGKVPVEGDDVLIDSDMWIELDLAETPRLKKMEINGRLSFKDDKATLPKIHLMAHLIWVRAGELLIGTKEKPFEQEALIEMLGETESETLTLGGTVKAGNKVLATNNKVEMFGKKRCRMSRMIDSADAGDKEIKVDKTVTDFDWAIGDSLFIATSTLNHTHSEYRKITAITDGTITLDKALDHYHYGRATSTGDIYNNVDIRNEVLLLNRSVKVQGEKKDGWAGHVLVSDMLDGLTFRKGYMIADNVEFENLSQKDVGKGGIRWESATGSSTVHSRLSNSAIYGGLDWGLSIKSAGNLEIVDNVFVGWRAIGVKIDKTRNCTFTGNFIGDVIARKIDFTGMTIDKEACVAYGSLDLSENIDMKFSDNIAAGCVYAGFVVPSYTECGGSNANFKNNVAHSTTRYGAYAYLNPISTKGDTCVEWGYFAAYKTAEACAVSVMKTKLQKAHHFTCIDVQQGLSINNGGQESDDTQVVIEDSFFFGESESKDCPSKEECICRPKFAFMSSHCNVDGKETHPTSASALPITKSKGEGNWGGKITINRCTFKDFVGKSMCGERSVIFERNPKDSDKIPMHYFNKIVFDNVDDAGWAFLAKPDPGWANVKDCGNFPCTAPNNLIFTFADTTFKGAKKPSFTPSDFVIVPDDKSVGGTYPGCKHFPGQQIYLCELNNIGMMMFENLDVDAWDRALQPIFLKNAETGFNNTVNSMMDHIWDTFYTGQRRMGRFPVALLTAQDYELEFSATPPKKIRFGLEARTGGTKIKIPYPVAGSFQVEKLDSNGVYQRVDNNGWDDKTQSQAALVKTKGCGENRFVGIKNFLEFWLEPGCELQVSPKDSIQAKVRMDWSMAEFFADGGTTRFVDRLASSLGIDAFRVKVVSMYEGSVVVDFVIETPAVEATKKDANGNVVAKTSEEIAAEQAAATAALASVKTVMVTQASTGTLSLGAPVMGLEAVAETGKAELLAGDPIPAAPSKNPDLSWAVPTSGALDYACAWITFLTLAFNLM